VQLRSPKLAVVGLGLILFAIVFTLDASGSAGVVALDIAVLGLALILAA